MKPHAKPSTADAPVCDPTQPSPRPLGQQSPITVHSPESVLPSLGIWAFRHFPLPISLLLLSHLFLVGCGSPQLSNYPPRNLTICCFGDSLVEGVGASNRNATSYPAQLSKRLGTNVVNWGTSGDTTQDGVNKLKRFQDQEFGVVIVTLGGNDILRRVNWQKTKDNLSTIFTELAEAGNLVVFTGVVGPLNPTRSKHYGKLCDAHGVLYVPDVLDGITGNSDLLADEIHPNDDGYNLMAERVANALREAGLFAEPGS